MKKYLFGLFMAVIASCAMTACSEEDGQLPGNDKNPAVTIYLYDTPEDYDGDCDAYFGLFSNNQASEIYYLAEPKAEKTARVSQLGEAGYVDYVIANGTKVSASVDKPEYVVLQKVFGEQVISAVAVNGGQKSAKANEITFTGVQWETLATGTYACGNKSLGYPETPGVELQKLSTDSKQLRFKNLFGKNKHLKFTVLDFEGDSGGIALKVPAQQTNMTYGSYGTVSCRCVGTWQGDEGYCEWNNYYPEEGHYMFIYMQYYVSAGSLGYGPDEFIPD